MDKDTEISEKDEVLGDQSSDAVDSGKEVVKSEKVASEVPDEISDKKPSIRDALKHAFKKEKAEIEKEEIPNKKSETLKKPASKQTEGENDGSEENIEKNEAVPPEKLDDKNLKTSIKPPVGWTSEAKAKWDTLPQEVQASIAKREKEVSDGFKKYGEETSRYKELESVLAPRRESIRQFGQSEAATVNRLFQWMEALTHSNRDYAYEQFVQLGKNFGIEIKQPETTKEITSQNKDDIPAPLKQFMDTVGGKLSNLEQSLQAQKENEAKQFVDKWSKDKPHFNAVRAFMFTLLQNGTIPLKDGGLDLDAAYDAAIHANPTTRELVRQEAEQKGIQDAKAKKAKIEADRLDKLNKAKSASSSLSVRAPSGNTSLLNGKKPPAQSIRDSIRAAIQEVREE